MTRRCVDRLGMSGRRSIAPAIVWRTQVGSAFENLARDAAFGLTGIVAFLLFAAAWIFRNAARLSRIRLVALTEPVRGPLPDVANHVVEAVVVGWEGPDRRRSLVAVLSQVLRGKLTLPGVGHHLPSGVKLIAPRKFGVILPPAGGEFPFRFGGQIISGPAGVGQRVLLGDVHHGMLREPLNGAART